MATDTDDRTLRKAKWTPYLLAAPALPFIYFFFLVPLVTLLKISLSERQERGSSRVDFTLGVGQLLEGLHRLRRPALASAHYTGITTVVCILLAYPSAYFIAVKAGRWRNLLLGLVMVPFFTSFLLRTIAWQSLFSDNGPVLGIAEACTSSASSTSCTSRPTGSSSTRRPR